jgi:hypothetical protein
MHGPINIRYICDDIHYATTTLHASWPKLKPSEEWNSSIHGYSRGKVNIWEDERIGHFEREKIISYEHVSNS